VHLLVLCTGNGSGCWLPAFHHRDSEFKPGPAHVRLLRDKIVHGHVFLRIFWFFPSVSLNRRSSH